MDSLIFQVFENGNIHFSENALLELIQSGKLQYIKNDKLKNLIFEWTQQKTSAININDAVHEKNKYLINYLYKKYPIKNIDAYGSLNWQEPSVLKINKLLIFGEIEFENILDDYLFNTISFIKSQKILQDIIEQIVVETEL